MSIVRATTTVHLPDYRTIAQGALLDDSDPAVVAHPRFFEPLDVAVSRTADVVDATARPGAKRK